MSKRRRENFSETIKTDLIILTAGVEGTTTLSSAALDDPPDNHLVPLVPHGGAKRLVVLGDLDHSGVSGHTPSVPGGTIALTPRLVLGPGIVRGCLILLKCRLFYKGKSAVLLVVWISR